MHRSVWPVACVVTLSLSTLAWSQNSPAPTTSDNTGASTSSSLTQSTDGNDSFRQQLREELVNRVVEAIHGLFRDIRTSLGLPEVATDPITDPLAILENVIVEMVDEFLQG